MTPGITGRPGKWPWKNHSVAATPLIPTIRFASASYSTIRSTRRIGQRCGIRAWISAVEWIVVQLRRSSASAACRSRHRSRAAPVGVVSVPRDGVVVRRRWVQVRTRDAVAAVTPGPPPRGTRPSRPDRAGSSSSGPRGTPRWTSSAWWIGTFVDEALDHQLGQGDVAALDRGRPGRSPDDQLAEQRVVERRDLVAGVQVGVHPDARARPARGSGRRRRRPAGTRAPGPRR